jgi:hypothetical protein
MDRQNSTRAAADRAPAPAPPAARPLPLARVATNHLDSCHLPDDDDRHFAPSTAGNTPAHSPLPSPPLDSGSRGRLAAPGPGLEEDPRASGDRTLVDVRGAEAGEAEKGLGLRRRERENGAERGEKGEKRQVPAEERNWPGDVVTFDSKSDPQNPKNVRLALPMGYSKHANPLPGSGPSAKKAKSPSSSASQRCAAPSPRPSSRPRSTT